MVKDCTKHDNYEKRRHLESVMIALQENQGGKGRHKCPYCAYEQGYAAGLRQAGETLRSLVLREAGLLAKKENC